MVWYYAYQNQQIGPKTDAEFRGLISQGIINEEMLVWREGMPDWVRLRDVDTALYRSGPAAAEGSIDAPMTICSACGRAFPAEDVLEYAGKYICAACKPRFMQQLKESGRVMGSLNYAGFWIRWVARLIDYVVFLVIGLMFWALTMALASQDNPIAGVMFSVLFGLVQFAIYIAYETLFLAAYGATPGKMAVRLKVVMHDGQPLTRGRAFGRAWAYLLSRIIIYIGCIIAAFDDEKRGLHDHLCSTRVVRA